MSVTSTYILEHTKTMGKGMLWFCSENFTTTNLWDQHTNCALWVYDRKSIKRKVWWFCIQSLSHFSKWSWTLKIEDQLPSPTFMSIGSRRNWDHRALSFHSQLDLNHIYESLTCFLVRNEKVEVFKIWMISFRIVMSKFPSN